MERTAVVAVGGNALTRQGQAGTWQEVAGNAAAMASAIVTVLADGWRVLVVHGNGPQVGALAIQHEEGALLVPPQPLHQLTAMTQGQLGSVLVREFDRLRGAGAATAVITHTAVDPHDRAFAHPSKPIGPFMARADADAMAAERGWVMADDAGRGRRRMVPSPAPRGVLELTAIRALLDIGQIVVAGGGGGVPVAGAGPALNGVDAVVDKDATAAVLASALRAHALLLLTAVDAVRLDFGTPDDRPVYELGDEDAERYLARGQFPAGSMGPKVQAAVRFVRSGGRMAAITSPGLMARTLAREPGTGTRIVAQRHAAGVAT